jgi:hypothetical protein
VVDTTNSTFKTSFRGSHEHLHLIERFTRNNDSRLTYRVTVEDPTTWTRPWTYEVAWTRPALEAAGHPLGGQDDEHRHHSQGSPGDKLYELMGLGKSS